jgi:hypothetical protein
MPPLPRRRRSSRPALAVASLGALPLLLLSACASGGAKRTDPAAAIYLAPLHVEVGHVISHDAKAGTALVVIGPFAKTPAKLAGQSLIARHPVTLAQTARLVASAHRTGAVFGAYVLEGVPSPDDEVVIPPATETSAAPATPSEASASTPAAPAP